MISAKLIWSYKHSHYFINYLRFPYILSNSIFLFSKFHLFFADLYGKFTSFAFIIQFHLRQLNTVHTTISYSELSEFLLRNHYCSFQIAKKKCTLRHKHNDHWLYTHARSILFITLWHSMSITAQSDSYSIASCIRFMHTVHSHIFRYNS